MKAIIKSISPLMNTSTQKKYCKLLFDDGDELNYFVNSKAEELTYGNLKVNDEIEFETGSFNGMDYIKWISNIIHKDKKEIKFGEKTKPNSDEIPHPKQQNRPSGVLSLTDKGKKLVKELEKTKDYPALKEYLNDVLNEFMKKSTPEDTRSILIKRLALLKVISNVSKKGTTPFGLIINAKQLEKLLEIWDTLDIKEDDKEFLKILNKKYRKGKKNGKT